MVFDHFGRQPGLTKRNTMIALLDKLVDLFIVLKKILKKKLDLGNCIRSSPNSDFFRLR